MSIIEIPIKDSQVGEVVEVDVAELPDVEDILAILETEESPRSLYHRFALEYHRQSRLSDFLTLINAGLADSPALLASDRAGLERIPLLNSLAAHYINLASSSTNVATEKGYFDMATANFNSSDRISLQQESTWLGKAYLLLAREKHDQASYLFKPVLDNNPHNIVALFGKACVLYNQKEFLAALKCYQLILRLSGGRLLGSSSTIDCRIGIGLCYWALGDYDSAVLALRRSIALNPSNIHSRLILCSFYYNLAKIDRNSAESSAFIHSAAEQLKAAQGMDKSNPIVNLFLSEFLFQKNQTQKSLTLALAALKNTENKDLRGYLSFCVARGYHDLRNFSEAFKYYQACSALVSGMDCLNFYIAQTFFQKGDFKSVIEIADKFADKQLSFEEQKFWAFSFLKDDAYIDRATSILDKLVQERPSDPDILVKISEALEKSSPEDALKYYTLVNSIFADKGEVSIPLLNNMASLHFNLNQLDEAEKTWETCRSICESFLGSAGHGKSEHSSLYCSVTWNLARLYEEKFSGDLDRALQLYEDLIRFNPRYLDAYFRAGIIMEKRTEFEKAKDYYKKGATLDKRSVEGWLLTGNLELKLKRYRESKVAFDHVLKHINGREIYALIAAGNDRLLAARGEPDLAKKDTFYSDAAKLFDKVLHLNTKCVYAAIGGGIALAENGHLDEARDVFSQARSTAPDLLSLQINLAHVLMDLDQYKLAIPIYESVAKRSEGDDQSTRLYLARALYISARNSKSAEQMFECVQVMKEIHGISPDDYIIRFDLALTLQQYAQLVVDKPEELRGLDELQNASESIDAAEAHFKQLKELKGSSLGYDPALAAQREKHCAFIRNSVFRQLSQQRANEELKKEKLEEIIKMREIEELRKRKESEEQEKKRLELEAQILLTREVLNAQLLQSMASTAEEEDKPKIRRKSRSDGQADEGERKRRRKPKASPTSSTPEAHDESDDSEETEKKEKIEKKTKRIKRAADALETTLLSEDVVEESGSESSTPRNDSDQ